MELLDLPLELLQIIIEMLVNTTTQLGSFRLRGVNSELSLPPVIIDRNPR